MMKLKVVGMSCNHCVMAVSKALSAVPGVARVVEVSLERGEAVIEGDADVSQLLAAVEEEGFKAQAAG